MRRWFSNKKALFTAFLILFILSQILGTIVIKSLFVHYKIKELSPRLAYIANEIATGKLEFSRNNDFILKAFDIYGNELNLFNEEIHESVGISETFINQGLVRHIPKSIAGNKVALLERIEGQASESIVIGMPIIKDETVTGVAFLLKPASDFEAVLNGFYLVFSVILIGSTCFIGLFLYLYIKEIKDLEQMRRDYIANISHELKSPIASIRALTETLADKVVHEEETKEKYYGIILKESVHLQKLISDMLELSRLQSGKVAFLKDEIDTKSLMQDLNDKYLVLASDLDITFEITSRAFSAPRLYSNKDRILQVFNIFIDNAIKFVPEAGSVLIDAKIHRKYVTFYVIDNGPGIDQSILPYIFDRFYKEDTSHNNNGSGLGLSIAKEIALGLEESITVSNTPTKGASFAFTIQRI